MITIPTHVTPVMHLVAIATLLGLTLVMSLSLDSSFRVYVESGKTPALEVVSYLLASAAFLGLAAWWLSLGGGDLVWLGVLDLWWMAALVSVLSALPRAFGRIE